MHHRIRQQQPVHWSDRLSKHHWHTKLLAAHDDMYVPISRFGVIVTSYCSCSDDGSRQNNRSPDRVLCVRRYRYWNDVGGRTFERYTEHLCADSWICAWNGQLGGILHLSCVLLSPNAKSANLKNCVATACDTAVNVAISFGGPSWSVSPADFQLTQLSSSQCVGAFFVLSTLLSATSNENGLSWVVGDTFLVRVVFCCWLYCAHAIVIAEKRVFRVQV